MLIGSLFFFGVMSIQILCPFLNWVIVFLSLNCKSSFYVLDTTALSDNMICRYFLLWIVFSLSFFLFSVFIYLFIYLWLHWVFVTAHGLSLVVASGGYS